MDRFKEKIKGLSRSNTLPILGVAKRRGLRLDAEEVHAALSVSTRVGQSPRGISHRIATVVEDGNNIRVVEPQSTIRSNEGQLSEVRRLGREDTDATLGLNSEDDPNSQVTALVGDRKDPLSLFDQLPLFNFNPPGPSPRLWNGENHLQDGSPGSSSYIALERSPSSTVNEILFPKISNKHDTRLVTIKPGTGSDVVCTTRAVALHDELKYDAVSHFWGPKEPTATITLNGLKFSVRNTFYLTLKALRDRLESDSIQELWIDNLSIDQGDKLDKARQISKMHAVYSRAERVLAWLGPRYGRSDGGRDPGDAEAGIILLNTPNLLGQGRVGPVLESHEVAAIKAVAEREYWTRCWIIQELCVAKTARIMCGSKTASFDNLSANLTKFCEVNSPHVNQAVSTHLKSLAIFQAQESTVSRNPQMSLIKALLLTRHSQASVVRDKVHAILSLAHDSSRLIDTLNYDQSQERMFWKLAHNMIHLQGHVAIILLARRDSPRPTRLSPSRRESQVGSNSSLRDLWSSEGLSRYKRNTKRISTQDFKAFHGELPSWAPFWPQLDHPLPPWIEQSIDLDQEYEQPPVLGHSEAALLVPGVLLERIDSVSGMPERENADFHAPDPNYPQRLGYPSNPAETQATRAVTPIRTETGSAKQFGVPHSVIDRLWRTLLGIVCLLENTNPIPAMDHVQNCYKRDKGCRGLNEGGYAVARVLLEAIDSFKADDHRKTIQEWMQINKSMMVGEKNLESWLRDHVRQRESNKGECSFGREAKELAKAFKFMGEYKMRLAVTNRCSFKLVYREASRYDHIFRIENCSLPIVLRPIFNMSFPLEFIAEPKSSDTSLQHDLGESSPLVSDQPMKAEQYRFIGEVLMHNHWQQQSAFMDKSNTGWSGRHFDQAKWTQVKIV